MGEEEEEEQQVMMMKVLTEEEEVLYQLIEKTKCLKEVDKANEEQVEEVELESLQHQSHF